MPYAQDLDTGEWVEVDAAGNPVAAPTQMPAMPQGVGRTVIPPNAMKVAQAAIEAKRKADADARASGADARSAAAAERAEREWNATHNPDGTPRPNAKAAKPLPHNAAAEYEKAITGFGSLDRAINGFQDDYAGNPIIGGLENTTEANFGIGTPGQSEWWADFRATDNILRNALFGASLTAGEKAAYEATSISERMTPDKVKANLARRRELAKNVFARRTAFLKANGYDADAVDALAGVYGQELSGPQQRNPDELDKVAAIPDGGDPNSPPPDNSPPGLPPANAPGGQDTTPLTPASGGSRWVADPRAAALVNSLVNAGAGEATINAAMKKRGFDPMPLGQFNAVRNWMRQNPGQRYTGATAGERQPLSLLERAAGSSPGAAVANWADAATAGISTALAGERGRGALDAMRAASPNASAVGGIGGGIVGAGAAELALAARAPAALAQYAPRIADTLYGGLTGFNSANEGEGGMGALIGGGAGLAGGFIGERAMRGAGAAFRGITDPAAQTLRARGVPLTVGQAVGNSGRLGEFVKNTEDAMTSIPVVGGMVNARRLEGLRGFNEAAFDVAGTPIAANVNNIGSRGLRELADARTQAYRAALDPVTIDTNADPQMIADLAQARLAAQAIPNVQPTMPSEFAERSLENRIQGNIDPNGLMSGRNFQEGYRGLARDARGRATADYGHEIGEVARQGQDVLSGALERQNPGAFEAFRAANATNRNAMTLADAVNRAKNTLDEGDEIFTPAQLNIADTGSSRRLTGPMASATGNRPFYDLAQAGQSVLPSKLPDSGTASRMMTGLALGGLAGAGGAGGYALGGAQGAPIGTGLGLGAALALALGGTRGAQNVAVRGLLDRPDVAITIGEELRRRAALGGVGGAGILAQIVAGQ